VPLHPDDHLARALAGGSSPHRSGPSRPWSPWGTPPSVDDTGGCRASYARCSRPTVRHRWIDRRSWRLPPRGYAVARGGRPGPAAAQAGPGAVRGHHARPDGARQPVAGAGGRRPSRVGGLLELPLSSCSGPPTVVDCSAAPGGPTAPLPRPLGDQTRCRPAAARVAHAAAARRAVTSPRPHPLLGAPAPGGPWLRPGAQRPDQRTAAPGSGRRGLPRPADLLRDHHGPAGERAVHRHGLPGGGGMDAHRTVQPSDARPRPARDARRRRQHCSAPAAGRAAGPSLPAGSTDVSCAGQPGRFRPRPPARRLRLGSRANLQPVRRRSDLLRSRSRRAAPRLIRAVTEIARGRVS
jgi:hypothetical protein